MDSYKVTVDNSFWQGIIFDILTGGSSTNEISSGKWMSMRERKKTGKQRLLPGSIMGPIPGWKPKNGRDILPQMKEMVVQAQELKDAFWARKITRKEFVRRLNKILKKDVCPRRISLLTQTLCSLSF